jgi:hypothetical protein
MTNQSHPEGRSPSHLPWSSDQTNSNYLVAKKRLLEEVGRNITIINLKAKTFRVNGWNTVTLADSIALY